MGLIKSLVVGVFAVIIYLVVQEMVLLNMCCTTLIRSIQGSE